MVLEPAQALALLACFWSGLIGLAIGRRKGLALGGFAAGALLGPFGWLAVALARRPGRSRWAVRREVGVRFRWQRRF
jgi:hypothetical protein